MISKYAVNGMLWVVLVLFNSAIFAGGWGGSTTVSEIYPSIDNNGVLVTQAVMIDPDTCNYSSHYVLEKDHVLFNEIFTLLMSAQARQSEVQIYLAGCSLHTTPKPKINAVIAR